MKKATSLRDAAFSHVKRQIVLLEGKSDLILSKHGFNATPGLPGT